MTEQLPPDVIAQLTALDPEITPDLVAASWAVLKPFHEKAGYTAPKIARDLRYGDHERHRLDVHTAGDETNAPVFVFVHGGGFIGGDKQVPGSPLAYDFLGAWAVRNGWVGVTITYRLAPEHHLAVWARRTSPRRSPGSGTTSRITAVTRTGSWSRAVQLTGGRGARRLLRHRPRRRLA